MEAKEKANDLVSKILDLEFEYTKSLLRTASVEKAKQCALICVNELINSTQPKSSMFRYNEYCFEYWEEVKQEIEKL